MPVHQSHTVQQGTKGRTVYLFGCDAAGNPATGAPLAGATAAYVRSGDSAEAITIATGGHAGWAPGRLVEVDPDLLPGVYEFGVPDEVIAAGATEAVLLVRAPRIRFDPVKFNLVAYDPQDAWSLGMTQLQDYKRHQVLRQALTRFTEMELALGQDAERRLAERLGEIPSAPAEKV